MGRLAVAVLAFESLVSHVSGFGAVPDFPSGVRVGIHGASVIHEPYLCESFTKLDQSFCTEITYKNFIGSEWCGTVSVPAECGCGSDTFRQSSNEMRRNTYDLCYWDQSANNGAGKCKTAGVYFDCGPQCSPNANTGANVGDQVLPPAPDTVSRERRCVSKMKSINGTWVQVDECYYVNSVIGRRLQDDRRSKDNRRLSEEIVDDEVCTSANSKVLLSSRVQQIENGVLGSYSTTIVETYRSCTMDGENDSAPCTCRTITSMVNTDPEAAAPGDDVCEDVWPPMFSAWSRFSAP